ncbi:hypothetical protein JIN85_20385 [Luteolibacter pohnpeiensis]|uniref:Uncharacterized protein n=1 Tax=Luteolibacter pohnpeiensis TaxID=454153 RepID=A0A934VYR3_9BACT|nr:hypothetical protein [Luteolibacter pohnpeiensis]MBK1884779.1 hypothetical protein [Luteolibacter pohnpeiensis]
MNSKLLVVALLLSVSALVASLISQLKMKSEIRKEIAKHEAEEVQRILPYINESREAFGYSEISPQNYSDAAIGYLEGLSKLFGDE